MNQRTVRFQVNDGEATTAANRNIHITQLDAADFGDAPITYPTARARDGASHLATGPQSGSSRDGELDGLPTERADGDDRDGIDDEDGVTLTMRAMGSIMADSL
jgi:heme-binding NEAT domain protein